MKHALAIALALVLLTVPVGFATISLVQDDGGTGGDAGNTPAKADTLWNRNGPVNTMGAQHGAYFGEMYRAIDESDWYYFTLPQGADDAAVSAMAQASPDQPCLTAAPDLAFVAQLLDPSGNVVDEQSMDLCYHALDLHAHDLAPGKWKVGFLLAHVAGSQPVPTSTYVHEQYAFDLQCDPTC